jgi:hypothetical protein
MTEVRSLFLWLTSKSLPYGSDSYFDKKLIEMFGFKYDDHKNLYKVIMTDENTLPSTMFTAHLDTIVVSKFYKFCKKFKLPFGRKKIVQHIFSKDNSLVKSDGTTTLGADDKAGVTIILEMIKCNKPGVYYLFKGEEVGRIGSINVRNSIYENFDLNNVKKCISLDRKGYTSIITHQNFKRTCSDEFAIDICKRLNKFGFWFNLDPEGANTDSVGFADRFGECTNISVGYFRAHTNRECQDLEFLEELCDAFTKINWERIRSHRTPSNDKTLGILDFSYRNYKLLLAKYHI